MHIYTFRMRSRISWVQIRQAKCCFCSTMAQDRDKHVVPQETSDKHQPQEKEQYLLTQQATNKHQPQTGPLSQIHRHFNLGIPFLLLNFFHQDMNCLCYMLNDAPKTPNRNCSYHRGWNFYWPPRKENLLWELVSLVFILQETDLSIM